MLRFEPTTYGSESECATHYTTAPHSCFLLANYNRSLFGRSVVFCAERFNCSINDLIYGRLLPIIINSHVSNSVDETTLDRVAFLRELIRIRDSTLTLSGLLSSNELNHVILHVCTSELAS